MESELDFRWPRRVLSGADAPPAPDDAVEPDPPVWLGEEDDQEPSLDPVDDQLAQAQRRIEDLQRELAMARRLVRAQAMRVHALEHQVTGARALARVELRRGRGSLLDKLFGLGPDSPIEVP